jgi:hypothetical protein
VAISICFDPTEDDGFDDNRCRVAVSGGGFGGEARFRNRDPKEFGELAEKLEAFPLPGIARFKFFDGLFRIEIEPIGLQGALSLNLALADENDGCEVKIVTWTSYSALQRFTKQLKQLIEANEGLAEL